MLPPPITSRLIRFGTFQVDPKSREVYNQGRRIRLQQQPFLILSLLLDHPGEVVTREEMRERLWPRETFVDFDQGLNKAINKLRKALGDSAESPRHIETLNKCGYRLLVTAGRANQDLQFLNDGCEARPQPVVGSEARETRGPAARWRMGTTSVIRSLLGLAHLGSKPSNEKKE